MKIALILTRLSFIRLSKDLVKSLIPETDSKIYFKTWWVLGIWYQADSARYFEFLFCGVLDWFLQLVLVLLPIQSIRTSTCPSFSGFRTLYESQKEIYYKVVELVILFKMMARLIKIEFEMWKLGSLKVGKKHKDE